MTVNELRKLKDAKPFVPFEICVADGQRFKVVHPENIALSPTGRTVFVFEEEGGSRIDLLLVTTLRELNGKRNGKH